MYWGAVFVYLAVGATVVISQQLCSTTPPAEHLFMCRAGTVSAPSVVLEVTAAHRLQNSSCTCFLETVQPGMSFTRLSGLQGHCASHMEVIHKQAYTIFVCNPGSSFYYANDSSAILQYVREGVSTDTTSSYCFSVTSSAPNINVTCYISGSIPTVPTPSSTPAVSSSAMPVTVSTPTPTQVLTTEKSTTNTTQVFTTDDQGTTQASTIRDTLKTTTPPKATTTEVEPPVTTATLTTTTNKTTTPLETTTEVVPPVTSIAPTTTPDKTTIQPKTTTEVEPPGTTEAPTTPPDKTTTVQKTTTEVVPPVTTTATATIPEETTTSPKTTTEIFPPVTTTPQITTPKETTTPSKTTTEVVPPVTTVAPPTTPEETTTPLKTTTEVVPPVTTVAPSTTPEETTTPPKTTTEVVPPVTTIAPTTTPEKTTTQPKTTTEVVPPMTTIAPTTKPEETTTQPKTTTEEVPPVTTVAPTTTPEETTTPPKITTAPKQTTTQFKTTTEVVPPVTTIAPTTAPEETTIQPRTTEEVPPMTTIAPTTKPEETTIQPKTTEEVPPVTTIAPTTTPEETATPPKTTTAPKQTTTQFKTTTEVVPPVTTIAPSTAPEETTTQPQTTTEIVIPPVTTIAPTTPPEGTTTQTKTTSGGGGIVPGRTTTEPTEEVFDLTIVAIVVPILAVFLLGILGCCIWFLYMRRKAKKTKTDKPAIKYDNNIILNRKYGKDTEYLVSAHPIVMNEKNGKITSVPNNISHERNNNLGTGEGDTKGLQNNVHAENVEREESDLKDVSVVIEGELEEKTPGIVNGGNWYSVIMKGKKGKTDESTSKIRDKKGSEKQKDPPVGRYIQRKAKKSSLKDRYVDHNSNMKEADKGMRYQSHPDLVQSLPERSEVGNPGELRKFASTENMFGSDVRKGSDDSETKKKVTFKGETIRSRSSDSLSQTSGNPQGSSQTIPYFVVKKKILHNTLPSKTIHGYPYHHSNKSLAPGQPHQYGNSSLRLVPDHHPYRSAPMYLPASFVPLQQGSVRTPKQKSSRDGKHVLLVPNAAGQYQPIRGPPKPIRLEQYRIPYQNRNSHLITEL